MAAVTESVVDEISSPRAIARCLGVAQRQFEPLEGAQRHRAFALGIALNAADGSLAALRYARRLGDWR
jgi:hypothetical protein